MMQTALSRMMTGLVRPVPAMRRMLIVNGHPDPSPKPYCTALCEAYASGVRSAGHEIQELQAGTLLPSKDSVEFAIAMEMFDWSDRLFVAFPIWDGSPPPALVRLFNAFVHAERATYGECGYSLGEARRAKFVMTASFPSLLYRSNGTPLPIPPSTKLARSTIIGSIDTISAEDRNHWLWEMRRDGNMVT